jgi:hypothetical protein
VTLASDPSRYGQTINMAARQSLLGLLKDGRVRGDGAREGEDLAELAASAGPSNLKTGIYCAPRSVSRKCAASRGAPPSRR